MFLKKGSYGENVTLVQRKLQVLSHYGSRVDGHFGILTLQAVREFQRKSNLNADGIVGPNTWKKLFDDTEISPKAVFYPPKGRTELFNVFGDPLTSEYWKAYGSFFDTPPELDHCFTYQYQGKNGFWCNKLIIPHFKKVYQSIRDKDLANKLVSFDGCYNVRNIRGGQSLSTHSWGIAVDHNASTNPLGQKGDMDKGIVEIFESYGFLWGGRFKRTDPMHFQFAKGV